MLAARADVADAKALREVADQLRDKLGSGVVVLGGVAGGKVALVAMVTADLSERSTPARSSARSPSPSAEGRRPPDMAQGGGTDAGQLDAALESVFKLFS